MAFVENIHIYLPFAILLTFSISDSVNLTCLPAINCRNSSDKYSSMSFVYLSTVSSPKTTRPRDEMYKLFGVTTGSTRLIDGASGNNNK